MAIVVRFLNKATNETYRAAVIADYLLENQKGYIVEAAATGISAGAIGGAMAEEAESYFADWKQPILDKYAQLAIPRTVAGVTLDEALAAGAWATLKWMAAAVVNVGPRSHESWAQLYSSVTDGDAVPSVPEKLANPVLIDAGYGNFRIWKAIQLVNAHPNELGLGVYLNNYPKLVEDLIDPQKDLTAKLYALYLKEAEDWFKSKNTYSGQWEALPQEFRDALLVSYTNVGRSRMEERWLESTAGGTKPYWPQPFLTTGGGMNHLRNAQAIGEAIGLTGYGTTSSTSATDSFGAAAAASTTDALAYRFALRELRYVVLTGLDYSAFNTNGELDRYNPATGKGNLTDEWIADRQDMLGWLLQARGQPTVRSNQSMGEALSYTDVATGKSVLVQPSSGLGTTVRRIVFDSEAGNFLAGGDGADRLYGMGGDDDLRGGGGNDYLEGGAGNDTLYGEGGGNDVLAGGTGADSYIFSGAFGKDAVVDSDGQGAIKINDRSIAGTFEGAVGSYRLNLGPGQYARLTLIADSRSATGYQAVITSGNDSANTVTIANFDVTQAQGAQGYLGIKLGPMRACLAEAGNPAAASGNPFAVLGFDPTSVTASAVFGETGGKAFKFFLDSAAKAGDVLKLSVNTLGDKLAAIVGDDTISFANGEVIIVLAEGQTEVSFALVQQGGLDADAAVALSAQLQSADGSVVTANSAAITLKDDGEFDHTFTGDLLVKTRTALSDIYRDGPQSVLVVRQGEAEYVRDANGNLIEDTAGGVLVTHNAIYGSASGGNDRIDAGLGNDLLSGGAGNDRLEGGAGDDLIAGGAGNDAIYGGEGNDYISSAALVYETTQQYGPLDNWLQWGVPAGATVLASGGAWGVYRTGEGEPIWSGMGPTPTDAQSDIIDAGAGDDHVLASWGDDRVQGGTGADALAGLAGNDILEGGDDDDDLDGDGTVEAGHLNSVEGARHGSDFLDGGAGNDKIRGDGGADQLFGGIGNDRLYGDTGVPSSDADFLAAQYHGADYLDGEDGDDYLEGNGGADTLYRAATGICPTSHSMGCAA